MKCNVLEFDDPGFASSFISGVNSFNNEARTYLAETHNNFINKATNLEQGMMNRVNQTFDYFNNNIKINNIMGNLNRAEILNGDSNIYTITKDNYKDTGYQMRRFIMVNPIINNLESRNRITGYDGQFFNNEPDTPIKYNSDYYRAKDGILDIDDNSSSYITYSNSEDNDLTINEKLSINESWENILENIYTNDHLDMTDI